MYYVCAGIILSSRDIAVKKTDKVLLCCLEVFFLIEDADDKQVNRTSAMKKLK